MTSHRIVLVHPRPTRGGFTAVVMEARELVGLPGTEVLVVSEAGERLTELPEQVHVEVLDAPLASLAGIRQLRRAVRDFSPTVLHFHGRQAGVLGRIATPNLSRCHVLYTPHGTPWPNGSTMRWIAGELAEIALARRTDEVLCVSYAEMADWSRRDVCARVSVLPNPVSADGARPRLGTDGDERVGILVPSGYSRMKRLEVVVEAVALAGPSIKVTFCGAVDDAEYRRELERRAAVLGVNNQLTFREAIPDIARAMEDASLVVLPSFSEGMPIVGQEAISVGARVAWSRIPPHEELFGSSGLSFWHAEELAAVLLGEHRKADTTPRQEWLAHFAKHVRTIRSDYWVDVLQQSAHKRGGRDVVR